MNYIINIIIKTCFDIDVSCLQAFLPALGFSPASLPRDLVTRFGLRPATPDNQQHPHALPSYFTHILYPHTHFNNNTHTLYPPTSPTHFTHISPTTPSHFTLSPTLYHILYPHTSSTYFTHIFRQQHPHTLPSHFTHTQLLFPHISPTAPT